MSVGEGSSREGIRPETIFVQIPAYMDLQVIATVEDLFARAADSSRISVGICWQHAAPLPENLELEGWDEQLRISAVAAEQSRGVGWAKARAQALYQGEQYVLQVDCHSRFAQDWDNSLVQELKNCPHSKPVLSAYPRAFSLDGDDLQLKKSVTSFRYPLRFDEGGSLKLASQSFNPGADFLTPTPFLTPRFVFSGAEFIQEVAADPVMYFDEEELDLSLRAWMCGWQTYIPTAIPLWHLYNSDGTQRLVHWKENANWRACHEQSHDALRSLLARSQGGERDLDSFENYTGIFFSQTRVELPQHRPNYVSDLGRVFPAAQSLWEGRKNPPGILIPDLSLVDDPQPLNPLNRGDTLPHICFPNRSGHYNSIEVYGGEYLLIHLFSPQFEASTEAFGDWTSFWQPLARGENLAQICIYQGSKQEFEGSNLKSIDATWWIDHEARLSAIISGAGDNPGGLTSLLLSPNFRILDIVTDPEITQHLLPPLDRVAMLEQEEMEILSSHPPVMVIEDVLKPALITKILHYWQQGDQFAGAVGSGSDSRVKSESKRRTDVLVRDDQISLELDQAFTINLLPELKKITGYDINHRETYKIGCYSGEDRGHFRKHRDTGLVPLSHRQYAVSLMLNDDYEGGALVFPEYGRVGYKVRAGNAVVFPAPLMHEVYPVRSGVRMVLVTFLFDEDSAAFRSCFQQYENKNDNTSKSRFGTARRFENLPLRPIHTRQVTAEEVTKEEFEFLIKDVSHSDTRPR